MLVQKRELATLKSVFVWRNYQGCLRIHRSTGDSAQNAIERTNACIGEALVDGGLLEWNYYKPLNGLSAEEIETLSIEHITSK